MASLKERLAKKRENLKSGGGSFKTFIIKEGKTRFRHVPVGDEKDWSIEATTFFLGKEIGLVVSPHTFGEKCALYNAYKEMSESSDPDDRELSKKLKPGRRLYSPVGKYKDEKGKEPDVEAGVKLLPLTTGIAQDLIELYLDDEFGDFTDAKNGYDIKYQRTGKGKTDTEYAIIRCDKTKLPKCWAGTYDPEKMLREITPSYKETKAMLEKFLSIPSEDEGEEKPKKKKKSSDDEKPLKKKKKNKDL
jgi:hypothetical protein